MKKVFEPYQTLNKTKVEFFKCAQYFPDVQKNKYMKQSNSLSNTWAAIPSFLIEVPPVGILMKRRARVKLKNPLLHMKKKKSVLFCVLQLSNAPLIPGISKWKKELIFSGVVHPAKKVCQDDRRR